MQNGECWVAEICHLGLNEVFSLDRGIGSSDSRGEIKYYESWAPLSFAFKQIKLKMNHAMG